jgi:HAD superfamily hydrolase (TIGR01509 family)
MFDAVIFDLDGTLIDTESLALSAGIEAFAAMGNPVDPAFLHGLVGKDNPTGARLIRAAYPALDMVALDKRWAAGFEKRMAGGMPLRPGALDLLTQLTLPKAIATSSGRKGAARKINLAGLAHHFTHVIVLEDVKAPKPAPDAYLLAARRLGMNPARCVVFEDSDVGAEAAHRAGMHVVQVPDVNPTEGRYAHMVAPDLLSAARSLGLIPV